MIEFLVRFPLVDHFSQLLLISFCELYQFQAHHVFSFTKPIDQYLLPYNIRAFFVLSRIKPNFAKSCIGYLLKNSSSFLLSPALSMVFKR